MEKFKVFRKISVRENPIPIIIELRKNSFFKLYFWEVFQITANLKNSSITIIVSMERLIPVKVSLINPGTIIEIKT